MNASRRHHRTADIRTARALVVLVLAQTAHAALAQHSDRPPPPPASATPAAPAPAPQPQMQQAPPAMPAPAPGLPREPIPAVSAQDRDGAFSQVAVPDHGEGVHAFFLLDQLETFEADRGRGVAWEGVGWIGKDIDRLWLRSQGERSDGRTGSADLEALYGRSISPWWDVVAGVRHDVGPGAPQSFAAIGVQGLAPQKFEVQATAYVGERGQTAARVEVEYTLYLSGRLILQPSFEAELYGRSDRRRGIGSGLGAAEAGLRLRYEFTRRFAPYIGVIHERAFGDTATWRREGSERVDDTRVVVGLRTWF